VVIAEPNPKLTTAALKRLGWGAPMNKYCGQVVEIATTFISGFDVLCYRIKDDGCRWSWAEEWLDFAANDVDLWKDDLVLEP